MNEVDYHVLWNLAENNVRALEAEKNDLARQLGVEVANTRAALRLADDWERAYRELAVQFEEHKKARP